MYETTPSGRPNLGPAILKALSTAGYPITRRRSVCGEEYCSGLIAAISPDASAYPTLPEFNRTLDWYLLKKRF